MTGSDVLQTDGRGRSPATMPGFGRGRPPSNKGLRFPADPPTVEEIVAVMRAAGDSRHGLRTRALIVVLWRAGLRISEALTLTESDLDPSRGSILIRRGKGGRRREVGLDAWAWQYLNAWLEIRVAMRVGALLCVIDGPTQGRPWSATAARATLRRLAAGAGVRRRFAPHHPRGRAAAGHPAPTRSCQPRDHLDLPPRYRQQRDHRHRPPPAGASASGQRRAPIAALAKTSAAARSGRAGGSALARPRRAALGPRGRARPRSARSAGRVQA